jgi:hypothetical protein
MLPTVISTSQPPTIITASIPSATAGIAYSTQLAANGGTPPYTWSKTSSTPGTGGFPAVSSSGLITGTPSVAETESLVVQVSDRGNKSANKTYSLPVAGLPSGFDYYMSPTGDDNNSGTFASPWSITAFNIPAKRTLYTGKRIGLLPGTYTGGTIGGVTTSLYSLYGSLGGTPTSVICIQGGTVANPTYVGAASASGVYAPPVLGSGCSTIIDSSLPGSGGATVPVASTITAPGIIGQAVSGSNAISTAQMGNITFAGIYVKYFTYAGIVFNATTAASIPNVTIQDCEVAFGNNISSNNNPGAIAFYKFPQNLRITNCKIHDLTTVVGGGGGNFPWGHAGVMINQDPGTTEGVTGRVDHCSIYKVGQGVTTKNNYSNVNIDHCYIEFANMGVYSGSAFPGAIYGGTQGPGKTVTYSYNVIVGNIYTHGEDATQNQGQVVGQNNTFYCGPGGANSTASVQQFTMTFNGAAGGANFNHNIVYSASGYNTGVDPYGSVGYNQQASPGGSFSYAQNYYGTGMVFGRGTTAPTLSVGSFTAWKALGGFGYDATSSLITGSPFVTTPVSNSLSTFVVNSPYITALDGQPAGALNASGLAADGSGIVGCNF